MAKPSWSRLLFTLISIIFLLRESQAASRTVYIGEAVTYIRASTKALGSQLSPRAFLYLDELEKQNPEISIPKVQQSEIINALITRGLTRLDSAQTKTHRRKFTKEAKEEL